MTANRISIEPYVLFNVLISCTYNKYLSFYLWSIRFHADSSPGLIADKSNQSENEVYPSEEQETIGAKYYLSTGKELPFCRKF